jgi:hypothetical protein
VGIPIRRPSRGFDVGPVVMSSDWADMRFALSRQS